MPREERMYKTKRISVVLLRLLHPYKYHLLHLLDRDPLLRFWFEGYADQRYKISPPNIAPLIQGAVQPADFVKAKTAILPQEIPPVPAEEKWQLIYELFKEKKSVLSDELVYQSILLGVEMDAACDHYLLQVCGLFSTALAFTFALIALSLIPFSRNPFTLLAESNLGFASVLLIPPTVALFIYGRLMRAFYNRKKEIATKITRIAAAHHALDTLDDVYKLRQRLEAKIRERKEERREEELSKLKMEERRREMEIEIEHKRRRLELDIERARREMELEIDKKRRDLGLWPTPPKENP